MRQRPTAANDGKNLQRTIVALDGPLSDGGQRNAVPDTLGDNRVCLLYTSDAADE